MSEIEAHLFQSFIEKLSDNNAKMEGVLQASKDTAKWVENLDKSLHEEFNRTRALTQKVSEQSGEILVLNEAVSTTKDSLKNHKDGHWRFAGLIIAATSALVAVLNYVSRKG